MTIIYRAMRLSEMLQFFGVRATAEHLRARGYTLQQCFDIISVNL